MSSRVEQLQNALWKNQPLATSDPNTGPSVLLRPDDPIWRAAKTGGLSSLLTSEEISAYSEVEMIAAKIEIAYERLVVMHADRVAFEHEFPATNFGPDLSYASSSDLRQYVHLLTHAQTAAAYVDRMVTGMAGAEAIILRSSFDVREMRASEQSRQSAK